METYRSNVFKLAFGGLVSTVGSEAAFIALSYTVYQRTHSAIWLSGTLLMTFGINGLFQPYLGSLGDRFDRRRVMIVADLAACGLFAAVAFATSPAVLVGLAFFSSLATMAFWPAAVAATPNLVPVEKLTWANGVMGSIHSFGHLAGPFAGGLLVSVVDVRAVFIVNAVSFAVSAVMTYTVKGSFQEEEHAAEGEHGGVGEGFRFLWRNRLLRQITIAWFLLTIAINIAIVADLPLSKAFGMGVMGYGLINSAVGVGALIGAFLARKTKQRSEWWAILMGSWVTALAYGAVVVSPWFAFVVAASALVGFSDAFAQVAGTSLAQRSTPDAIRSRLFAAWSTSWLAANVVAFTVGGPLLNAFGPRGVYAVGTVVSLVSLAVMLPAVTPLRTEAVRPGSSP